MSVVSGGAAVMRVAPDPMNQGILQTQVEAQCGRGCLQLAPATSHLRGATTPSPPPLTVHSEGVLAGADGGIDHGQVTRGDPSAANVRATQARAGGGCARTGREAGRGWVEGWGGQRRHVG